MGFSKFGTGKLKVYLSISKMADPVFTGKVKRHLDCLDCTYSIYDSNTPYSLAVLDNIDIMLIIPPANKNNNTVIPDEWTIGKGQISEIDYFLNDCFKDHDDIFILTDINNGLIAQEFIAASKFMNATDWRFFGQLAARVIKLELTYFGDFRVIDETYFELSTILNKPKTTVTVNHTEVTYSVPISPKEVRIHLALCKKFI